MNLNLRNATKVPTTAHMPMTPTSCQSQGDAPGSVFIGAKVARMKRRTGKYAEILASALPEVRGYHNPDKKSSTKKRTEIIGPAESSFGTTVEIAMPSALKHSTPIKIATKNAA